MFGDCVLELTGSAPVCQRVHIDIYNEHVSVSHCVSRNVVSKCPHANVSVDVPLSHVGVIKFISVCSSMSACANSVCVYVRIRASVSVSVCMSLCLSMGVRSCPCPRG